MTAMEIVFIAVGIVIIALQVLQFMDRRKQQPTVTPLGDPTAPVYVADDVQEHRSRFTRCRLGAPR
jgi:hypothetical protein